MSVEDGIEYDLWNKLRSEGYDIPVDDYLAIRKQSIKYPESDTMTLGKYFKDADGNAAPNAYTSMAENAKDTYFDLGTKWEDIRREYNLSEEDMFELFNKSALDDSVNNGKTIRFSQDPTLPAYKKDAIRKEWDYLQSEYDYIDVVKKGDFWYGIK